MLKATESMEENVSCTLPEKFALSFDGWTIRSRYMAAASLSYLNKSGKINEQVLLRFYQFEDEANNTAEENMRYRRYVLSFYHNSWDNIVAVVVDNCAVNVS